MEAPYRYTVCGESSDVGVSRRRWSPPGYRGRVGLIRREEMDVRSFDARHPGITMVLVSDSAFWATFGFIYRQDDDDDTFRPTLRRLRSVLLMVDMVVGDGLS